jgi:squalene/oxidosqualene cyclase-like protein
LWLLPEALPIHPWRMWCHSRMVYLPMSWLYGRRATVPVTPLIEALRAELYEGRWASMEWASHRWTVAKEDDYRPVDPLYKAINVPLMASERFGSRRLRQRAMDFVLDQIRAEDRNTDFICIGPVNQLYHTLVWAFADRDGEHFRGHLRRLPDYLWVARDGTKMQGYNSSQLWDTAFMVQALVKAGAEARHLDTLRRAFGYVESNQVLEDVPDRQWCYRDPSKGGWPFSNRAHGWPITDCTAEGLKASLALEPHVTDPIGELRLTDAIDLILWFQNDDGGWASYERTRGPKWFERLNPSNCFGEIMIDWSYVECTAACLQAMAAYKARFPGRRDAPIDAAVARGQRFLLDAQRPDGSWYGSWGVCFTYGAWFATAGLRASGLPADHPALRRAAAFLLSKQLPDGGWGELAESSRDMRYVSTETGQAVMTSWALLSLAACGVDGPEVAAGLRFLVERQQADGSWPDEHISGMFNKTCAITYDNYTKIFPLWALATFRGR